MTRQFLACTFKPGGRQYTYHFDGDETVEPGRKVEAMTDQGTQKLTVARVVPDAPTFLTKEVKLLPIEEIAEASDEPDGA